MSRISVDVVANDVVERLGEVWVSAECRLACVLNPHAPVVGNILAFQDEWLSIAHQRLEDVRVLI